MSKWKRTRPYGIRIPFSRETKLRLTEKLMDWAEKQPKTEKWGFLYQLQIHRESQRRQSEDAYLRTRPPAGTQIQLLGLQLHEAFHYEDFDKLLDGLYSLFPDIDAAQHADQNFTKYFREMSEPLGRGGWHMVGYLYRDKTGIFGTTSAVRRVPNLSPFINFVQVHIQKSLASLISVRFDVHLSKEATEKLNELISKKYLSETTVQSIFLRSFFLGISGRTPEFALTKAVLQLLAEIRNSVEAAIQPHFRGHFLNATSKSCRLPAIEIYSIAGTTKNRKNFISWAQLSRHWWYSLGFKFYRYDVFGNRKILFSWKDVDRDQSLPTAHRLVIFPEKFFERKERELSTENQVASLWADLIDFSISVVDWIVLVDVFSNSFELLSNLRRRIFDAIKRSPTVFNNLSKYVQLHQEFQMQAMILRRLSLEFEQKERFIENDLKQVEDLLEIDIYGSRKKKTSEKSNLGKDILARINFSKKYLLGQIDLIEKIFSTRIESLNIDAAYRLQRTTIFLTVFAILIALLGLMNMEDVISSLKSLLINTTPQP